jgi:hypothetical protein
MAQAEYVTNAIRALITDASPKPSTNPARAAFAGFITGTLEHAAVATARHCGHRGQESSRLQWWQS